MRKQFREDLFEEVCHRERLGHENVRSNGKLRALGRELATDPKYMGYLSSHRFSDGWLSTFRKRLYLYDSEKLMDEKRPFKRPMDEKRPFMKANQIRKTLSQDVYEELSRRQSLTKENLKTWEKVRALALELAAQPKYRGYFDDFTCPNSWLSQFWYDFDLHQGANRMKEIFSQDLYEETCRRQELTGTFWASNENLSALANELAGDPKYKGYLSNNKFSSTWAFLFREKYDLKNPERLFSITEKQQIIQYCDDNPELSLTNEGIADHFSTLFGRKISSSTVSEVRRNREKLMEQKREENVRETFSKDLYEEMSRRQSLTEENLATNENLRPLATELAANPKYEGYLLDCKFSDIWISRFLKKYKLKETFMASAFVRKTFTDDLYEEMNRRQSLTRKRVGSNENLRALALELAKDPKYKGQLSNHKFSDCWISKFRKRTIYKQREECTSEPMFMNSEEVHAREAREAKRSFSEELFEEASRRQRLTNEDLPEDLFVDMFSNKNLKTLALELVRKPKYEKYMSSFKCSPRWLTEFRKKCGIKR